MQSNLHLKSDEELMIFYQDGNQLAFELLYKRHSSKVYGYLKNNLRDTHLADEVFQGLFLKLHTSRSKYDPAFPFIPWLFTICKSVMIDHLRKVKNIKEDSNQEFLENVGMGPTVTNEFPDLSILQAQQKDAINYRYSEDLSFEEIASKLQTSPINVRKIISRAIKKLKASLSEGSN